MRPMTTAAATAPPGTRAHEHSLAAELARYLATYVSRERTDRIEGVLANRTRHVTVVLEDLFHGQNGGAVLRSCECFGIQDVHIIAQRCSFRIAKSVAAGAAKWLTLRLFDADHHEGVGACVGALHRAGYRLAATTARADAVPIDQLELGERVALCFGNEREGLSSELLDAADVAVTVPMGGFTESLNVSVAAALCLRTLTSSLRRSAREVWRLTPEECAELRLEWFIKSLKHRRALVKRFCEDRGVAVPADWEALCAWSRAEPQTMVWEDTDTRPAAEGSADR